MRHLKNINELILYASISCGASFVGRLLPALYFPILLLRLGIFLYCAYVIAKLEGNKESSYIIGGSLFIGMIGGYWDLIEVYLRFNLETIATLVTMTIAFLIAVAGLILQVRALTSGKVSKK